MGNKKLVQSEPPQSRKRKLEEVLKTPKETVKTPEETKVAKTTPKVPKTVDKKAPIRKGSKSKDPIFDASTNMNELLAPPQKRSRRAPARYSEFGELGELDNFIKNADSNYDQAEGEDLKTKVQKKSNDQELDEVLKTPKGTKVAKTTS